MDYHTVITFLDVPFSITLLADNAEGNIILGLVLTVLLGLTFVISGAEVALFSLNNKDVNVLKTKQHPAAKRITSLLEEPKEVYASLLIAGTFINICIIILSNYLIDQYIRFGEWYAWLIILTKALMIVFVVVFFGRLLPKVYATQNNLRFAYDFSLVIETLHLFQQELRFR